ncbi:MAG: flavin reductase family protein [Flavobacteriales bacterium]|nr:flavin reductase family protein [Flavobacteriales bacterium]
MKSIDPKETTLAKMHGYLLGAIGPRPIALASTINENGDPNLAPFSFFNVFSTVPPILVFSPARRGRDNTTKHTYENAKATKECVINVVTYDIVQQTSLSSTEYAEGVSEFEKAGFTPVPSDIVAPYRVKESPVQFECIVKDIIEMGDHGGAGNLIMCEVVKMHIDESILDEEGRIDQRKIDLVARMGGNYYCRAQGEALFEVPKPLRNLGIGVDALPEDVRMSKILTGNDLGLLGNVEEVPNETDVNDFKLIELSDIFVELQDEAGELEKKLHQRAHDYLEKGQVDEAWKTLLSYNN